MRWFESSYGAHTLAAVLHDDLIVDEPNGGPLGSDTLSDTFFREMMKAAGVPWLKRWIMWAAVALRTRWAAGGIRRVSVFVWILLSSAGITAFFWAVGSTLLDWNGPDVWLLLSIALPLPFVAAGLWGRQYGAGIIAAAGRALDSAGGSCRRHRVRDLPRTRARCEDRRPEVSGRLPTSARTIPVTPVRRSEFGRRCATTFGESL